MAQLYLAFITFSLLLYDFKKFVWVWLALCQLLIAASPIDQSSSFSVDMQLSTNAIDIPEILEVKLLLHYPPGYNIDGAALKEHLLRNYTSVENPFKLLSESSQEVSDKVYMQTRCYKLQTQIPGRFPVTFLNIDFFPSSTHESPVQLFSPIDYVVVSLQPPSATIEAPIAEPLNLDERMPLSWDAIAKSKWQKQTFIKRENFPWLIFVGLLTLYGSAFVWQKAKKKIKLGETPSTGSQQQAKVALNTITSSQELTPAQVVTYVYFLVQWVRSSFEKKLHVAASTQTSEEFLHKMQTDKNTRPPMAKAIKAFLEKTDQIKFAQGAATQADCQALMDEAEEIIDKISENS